MARLTAIVLGAAAGGGFPQWNCACPVCRLAWQGAPSARPSTQASLAVSADGASWTLLNASPDLRAQIIAAPALHPSGQLRQSPIAAVILTGSEVDQTAGLLSLRERQPFTLHATRATLNVLASNPMFDVLAPGIVERVEAETGQPIRLPGGLEAELFDVPGKIPLYLERRSETLEALPGGNVGVLLRAGGASLAFAPGAAAITETVRELLGRTDVVFLDGTLFHDDEMIAAGVSEKTGARMGHLAIDGANGSLAALADIPGRKIYIHLNNTNPVLVAGSPERRKVEAAGWEVAYDGMRVEL